MPLETYSHSFRRPDGSVLEIRSTTGDGIAVIELTENEPAREATLEPEEE